MRQANSLPIKNQAPIFERLEAAKRFGLISEYLLNWRSGSQGWLPKVTVWSGALTARHVAQDQIVSSLSGFVQASQIVVLED